MSRPTNTPEDASGMRCLGCGYYDDEPQAQRMCEGGEGTGHAFVRVGPDGCVPAPDDDPATLRARLEKRYERPERPCTYDPDGDPLWFERARAQLEAPPIEPVLVMSPANAERFNRELAAACAMPERYDPADEEPEGDWTPPRPEPVEYSGIPVVVDPKQEEGTVILVWKPLAPAGIVWTQDTLDAWQARHDAATEVAHTPRPASEWMDLAVAPQGEPDPRNTVGGLSKKTFDPTWMDDMPVFRLGTKDNPGGFETFGEMRRKRQNPATLGTSRDAMRVEALRRPFEFRESSISLRSYLRTLTNPDATPEDVNGALDALTPEDRALVSEALPSWGSARMSRVEAIAPFMARFEAMVRERDPRAQEEGTLILSALREDDPTRSTIEALMDIAKTPKVNP